MVKRLPLFLFIMTVLSGLVFLPAYALAGDDSLLEFSVMGTQYYDHAEDLYSIEDASAFRDQLLLRGWTKYMEGYNTQVGDPSFGYAAPSDFMYYAGHGSWDGNVNTKYAGSDLHDYVPNTWPFPVGIVLYNDVDNTWNNDIEWAYLATCFTLKDARWKYPLNDAPRAHLIFGYIGLSPDNGPNNPAARNVVQKFFAYSNNYILYDSFRWATGDYGFLNNFAIIGHLNNKGDYLHGVKTGATADCSDGTDIYRWWYDGQYQATKLTTDISLKPIVKKTFFARLFDTIRSLSVFNPFKSEPSYAALGFSKPGLEVTGEVPAETPDMPTLSVKQEVIDDAKVKEWFGDFSKKGEKDNVKQYISDKESVDVYPSGALKYHHGTTSGLVSVSQDEAEKTAKDFIRNHGGLPQDAKLVEKGRMLQENLDSGKQDVVSYVFKYGHSWKNTPISYDGDVIEVEVSDNGVTTYNRLWRDIVQEYNDKTKTVISATDALNQSWEKVKKSFRDGNSVLKIADVDLVYYSQMFDKSQDTMEPAWRLRMESGNFVYIDAKTGDLIPQ